LNNLSETFLVDANVLITPHLTFYPFDIAPQFWAQLKQHIENGSISILDMVKDEIEKGNDSLSQWANSLQIADFVDHRNSNILQNYGKVLNHIQNDKCYNAKALAEWSQTAIADPWLVATAMTYRYTIITFEKPVGNLNAGAPVGHPKIPDVCNAFNVSYQNLYYMMRKLSITLG
jgi:hypothetical protein